MGSEGREAVGRDYVALVQQGRASGDDAAVHVAAMGEACAAERVSKVQGNTRRPRPRGKGTANRVCKDGIDVADGQVAEPSKIVPIAIHLDRHRKYLTQAMTNIFMRQRTYIYVCAHPATWRQHAVCSFSLATAGIVASVWHPCNTAHILDNFKLCWFS